MPEAYTHLRCAQAGAQRAHIRPQDPEAFAAGANGPDIFFCYRCWLPAQHRGENLPALAGRLHQDCTGSFLLHLLDAANTPAKRSYVLGYLTHYAVDTVLHPYVAAVTAPGQVYGEEGGHGYFEGAVDSWLHQLDTGDAAVYVRDCLPRITGARLAELGVLLQTALRETYNLDVSREALADTFHHTWYWRSIFVSRLRIKRGFFWLVEPLFGGRGHITGHMTPAHLKGMDAGDAQKLPDVWTHPFSGSTMHCDLHQLLEQAEQRSAAYLLAAQGYWQGKVVRSKLEELLGSMNYETGLEDEGSLGKTEKLQTV